MPEAFKSKLEVEWFNVSYRRLVTIVVTLALLVFGGGGYWYYYHHLAPRDKAGTALQEAETVFARAERHRGGGQQTDEILANADASLKKARADFAIDEYAEAMVAAIRSETLSQRVLTLSAGKDEEESKVRFLKTEGDVRVKRVGEFAWRRADQNMVLKVGDQIKTSSSSSARLIYFDGTVSTLQPGSLIEIRDLYEDPVTKVRRVRETLSWGEVEASTQKRNVSGSFHEVSTGKVTARSEEAGEFRIAFDKEKKTSTVDVFDGRIEVATETRKDTLDAGERVTARSDGVLSAKQALPGVPRLLAPSDQRVFIFEQPGKDSVSLSWEPVSGIDRYRLVIANRDLFTNPMYDAMRGDTTAVLGAVEPGSYFWRVAAISDSEVEGPFSAARRFRVSSQQIRDRKDDQPPKLEITEFVPIGQMVIINGKTEPGATLWVDNSKVDVFDDGSFNAVVRLRREGVNDLAIVAQDNAGNKSEMRRSAYLEDF